MINVIGSTSINPSRIDPTNHVKAVKIINLPFNFTSSILDFKHEIPKINPDTNKTNSINNK